MQPDGNDDRQFFSMDQVIENNGQGRHQMVQGHQDTRGPIGGILRRNVHVDGSMRARKKLRLSIEKLKTCRWERPAGAWSPVRVDSLAAAVPGCSEGLPQKLIEGMPMRR